MLIEADFLVEIIEESIVLIFYEMADAVLTRKFVQSGRPSDRDIRRNHCPDLS